MFNETALVIVGYLRLENLKLIYDEAKEYNWKSIYFYIDKTTKSDLHHIQSAIYEYIIKIAKYDSRIVPVFRSKNYGCALSVLRACEETFQKEIKAIILEDDCIPNSSVFHFFSKAFNEMTNSNKRILVASGTQFLKNVNHKDGWYLSNFPHFWGWCTTRENWNKLKKALDLKFLQNKNSKLKLYERIYWKTGAERASARFVDVWDTIFSAFFRFENFYSIQPVVNLITNNGNDEFATNVKNLNIKRSETLNIEGIVASPEYSTFLDLRTVSEIYHISPLHLISTKISGLKYLTRRKAFLISDFRKYD